MLMTISDPAEIMASLRRNSVNCYAIDDSQYLMSFKLISRINDTGYGKYTEIAKDFKDLVNTVVKNTSDDTIVYFLHHTERTDDGHVKAKTTGKMIDNWLTLEGLFSIVIMTAVTEDKHLFITQNDGFRTCKSPMGMLDNPMDNDLKLVDTKIREYYELQPCGTPVKKAQKQTNKEQNATLTTVDKVPEV